MHFKTLIRNSLGIHAGPAACIVKCVKRFPCEIKVGREDDPDEKINAGSMMGLMMLAAGRGATLVWSVEGPLEIEVAETIKDCVENRLFQFECENALFDWIFKDKITEIKILLEMSFSLWFDLKGWVEVDASKGGPDYVASIMTSEISKYNQHTSDELKFYNQRLNEFLRQA